MNRSCHICRRTPMDPVLGQVPDLHTCVDCEQDVCAGCAEIEGDMNGGVWLVMEWCRACEEAA